MTLDRSLKLCSLILDAIFCGTKQKSKCSNSKKKNSTVGSKKLSDILKQPEYYNNKNNHDEVEVKRKERELEMMKLVALKLQCGVGGGGDEVGKVLEAAKEVRRMAKCDENARTNLALLGVIPPLVALIEMNYETKIEALYALLNLAIANDVNKAAIVKAGAVHKMLKLIQSPHDQPTAEAVVANFLGLSALDSNKPVIGSSGAIPFLVKTLRDLNATATPQAKQDSLRVLYNLSISATNIHTMLETDLVPFLLNNIGDMDLSERILSILTNVVSVSEGRKVIGNAPDTIPILLDVLNWNDSPECQEKACYILMMMAYKSYQDRQAMIEAGIMSSLLELTLLGSTLAQKRASRMLDFLRGGKGKQVSGTTTISAPQCGSFSTPSPKGSTDHEKESLKEEEDEMMSQEKKAVKQLVQQSLQNNMNRMVKRANMSHDFVPSDNFKSLALSSTSKSLPF